jgi:hypothetical protein
MKFARTPLQALAAALVVGAVVARCPWLPGQEAAPAADALPPEPKGVEVMARGPVHEAFATPTGEAAPTRPVPKQPPKPLNEVPPEEKPEGDVVWIGGYWAWDDDRNDYLWVSGVWRTVPPGKQWVAGYWREDGDRWQWVNGFWTEAAPQEAAAKDITYLPPPPKPPAVSPSGEPPSPESFYVPGMYVWTNDGYAWRPGYWARVQPGYVWVPAHYRWTPSGYVYIAGYWDLAVSRRGFLYAPVVVRADAVDATFVYTPTYAVRDTVVLDALFVRPCSCHYYFGDYYGPRYQELGFQSCVVYSRTNYDAIIVYERYEHRSDPTWIDVQINLSSRRDSGDAPLPPRTLAQQNVIQQNVIQQNVIQQNIVQNNIVQNNVVNNNTVLMPATKLAAEKNVRTVKLDPAARTQALQTSRAVQEVAAQRSKTEVASAGIPARPRTAALKVPPVQPVRAASEPRPPVAPQRSAAAPQHNTNVPPNRTANPPPRTVAPTVHPSANPTPNRAVSPPPNGTPANHQAVSPARPGMPPPQHGPQGVTPPRPNQPPAQRPAPPPPNRQPPPSNRQPPPNNRQPPPDPNKKPPYPPYSN